MASLKQRLKSIFVKTNSLPILDKLNYAYAALKHFASNKKFKKQYPSFIFPPDYYLYETYRLDYKQYKEDGELTAKEILEWTAKYLQGELKILEWGCGVARIVRHIPLLSNYKATVFGTDINKEMIEWDESNISNVGFSTIDYVPPTHFADEQFNLIFALSVFTHIEIGVQVSWIKEIHRMISDEGIFLFTTHGKNFEINLSEPEKKLLEVQGGLTVDYNKKGHRMMSSYNKPDNFRNLLNPYFEILEYFDGAGNPDKVGGQDLWIVKKIN